MEHFLLLDTASALLRDFRENSISENDCPTKKITLMTGNYIQNIGRANEEQSLSIKIDEHKITNYDLNLPSLF